MKIIDKLRSDIKDLSKSERKVAHIVAGNMEDAIRYSIAKLAKTADVSEPTVNRFCRSMGCKGFADFKLRLAQEISSSDQTRIYMPRKVDVDDKTDEVATKIFESTMAAIANSWGQMDKKLIKKAVDTIAQTRKVEFFALGQQAAIAQMTVQQFHYLNVMAISVTDPKSQQYSAKKLYPGDVVIVLTDEDNEEYLLEAIKIANSKGATIISIAAPDSKIASESHIVLEVEQSQTQDLLSSGTPGIITQIWIDILLKGVLLQRGPGFISHLESIFQN